MFTRANMFEKSSLVLWYVELFSKVRLYKGEYREILHFMPKLVDKPGF